MPSPATANLRLIATSAVIMLSFVACAAQHSTPPASSPTTGGSGLRVIKVSDGIALSDLLTDEREANLTDKLSPPQSADNIYFGELDTYADPDDEKPAAAVPIIATKMAGAWSALPLGGEGLKNAGWRYVGSGPGPREIWGALDTAAGATRSEFVLAHSTDGGATFALSVFHKPCKLAEFFDFAMSRDGRGRASVSLDTDCGEHKAGIYHFETTDDGKTWNPEPRYEPDAMVRADNVSDDEQPDERAGQGASRTSFRRERAPIITIKRSMGVSPMSDTARHGRDARATK
jgi:hypothetical protein